MPTATKLAPVAAAEMEAESPKSARLSPDHMPPRRCLWTIYLFCVLVNVNLTVIIPTAPAYAERLGANASFSGVIVAAMSGIQLIIAPPIHWLFQRVAFKGILIIMSVFGILGNGLYALAGLTNSRWVLVSARMMVGVAVYYGAAFHYLSCAVGLKHRSAVMLKAVGAFAVGYVIGPLFAFGIGVFCDGLHIHHLVLDETTMPGWIMSVVLCLYLLVIYFCLDDGVVRSTETAKSCEESDGEIEMQGHHTPLPSPTPDMPVAPELIGNLNLDGDEINGDSGTAGLYKKSSSRQQLNAAGSEKLPIVTLCFLMFLSFIASAIFGGWEVFTSLLGKKWGWAATGTSLYLAGIMAALIPTTLFGSRYLVRWFSDRSIVFTVWISSTLSIIFLFDFNLSGVTSAAVIYTVGSLCLLSGLQVGRGVLPSLITKLVPTHQKGRIITFNTVCMVIGRTVGPLVASYLDQSEYAGYVMGLIGGTAVCMAVLYKYMVPHAKAE